ncbi:MAG: hypothetical protein ACFFEV_00695, partial [Candidatus Thorarchaeota archaeon]
LEEASPLNTRTILKQRSDDLLLVLVLILALLISSIPVRQEIEVAKIEECTSADEYRIEFSFGGPRVTSIQVKCNRTAWIRFLHQTGVWTSTETVLMASYWSATASYNVISEHSTYIVEVYSDGPIEVQIVYIYLMEMEATIFYSVLNPIIIDP